MIALALLLNACCQFPTTLVPRQPLVLNRGLISQLKPIYVPVNTLPTFTAPGIYGAFNAVASPNNTPPQYLKLSDFNYQSSNATGNGAQGLGAGKTSQQVVVKLPGSKATGQLMTDSSQERIFRTVDIYTVSSALNGSVSVAQKFEMKNAVISSFAQNTTAIGQITITMTLLAQAVEVSYPSSTTNGSGGSPSTNVWNTTTNSAH